MFLSKRQGWNWKYRWEKRFTPNLSVSLWASSLLPCNDDDAKYTILVEVFETKIFRSPPSSLPRLCFQRFPSGRKTWNLYQVQWHTFWPKTRLWIKENLSMLFWYLNIIQRYRQKESSIIHYLVEERCSSCRICWYIIRNGYVLLHHARWWIEIKSS